MNDQSRIIGIDLGTTNSVVAITIGSDPVVIPNTEGSNKTPSVVAFMENGEVVVGEIARRQASTNPTRTISSIKRLMGRTIEDIQDAGDIFPFSVISHEGELLVDIDGMGYRPEQVSALVIKKLKEAAEAYLGEEITQAVITVPAHFDDIQRQATIDAATMAQLNVLRLINEPTAAAMAYGMGRSDSAKDETVVVYDFGGGTFDVSILEISGKTFEVLTCTGDSHLGGDDLDNAIVNLVVAEFNEEYGIDLTADPVTLRRLKEVAERAKIELSSTNQANLALPFITYQNGQPLHLDRVLTRGEFEDLAEEAVRRTIRCCKRALEEAGISKKDISRVIMVGGTTRIPMVQDAVEEFFDQQIFRGVNPDEVVALGAATQAGVFEGNVQEVILLDVCPHSLGIEVEGGKFSKIIEKNATIPIKAAKTFTTTEANQAFVNIHVLQGENEEAAENRSLGKFALTGIPPAPAGVPRVRVTFFINSDGVMEISAEDMSTGAAQTITIVHSQLSDEEKNRRQRRKARSQGKVTSTTRRAAARKASGTGGVKKAAGAGGPASQSGGMGGRNLPPRPITQSSPPPSSQSGGMAAAPAPPAAVPITQTEKGDSQTQQRFAVLGDAAPSNMSMPGTRSRESMVSNVPEPLAPVDYSKAPPTYSNPPGAPPKARPSSPAGGQPPQAINAAAMADREPSSAMPPGPISSYPAMGPIPTRPVTPSSSSSSPPPSWHSDQTMTEMPVEVAEAIRLAEAGRDDGDAQRLYLNALNIITKGPIGNIETFEVLKARAMMHYLVGQLEDTRLTLQRLRDRYATTRPGEVLDLHEKALTRFGAPSLLRDRARLRALLGDLPNACADYEQAMRDEPAADDAAELENLYRQRTTAGDDPQAMFKLVKLLLKGNKVDEAIQILSVLQNHKGYEQRALKILGLCHWQKNMHYLAWQKFKTLPVDEDLKDILYRLAGDMEASDQLQNAVGVLEHLVTNAAGYRDAEARLRKLQYRLKLQKEEQEQPRDVPVLSKDSRFTIHQEINRGSMGIIYKAQDKTLNEVVALKVLNDYLCSDPSAVERFKSEARAAKRLSHPYIVRIHDMFEIDSKRFISMEYIEGQDLKRMIAEKTTFNEEQIMYYFVQICDALAYAHKLGIVHRDIKPANIMITNRNAVKITDFGIAKILRGDDATKSGTAVIGTPLYMAPEQIIGDSVDGRTDIYSLGIMMYEMLNGNPPFYLGNIEYHHIHTPPPALNERISPRVREAIIKMIAKKPEDRFQTVEDIVPFIKAT